MGHDRKRADARTDLPSAPRARAERLGVAFLTGTPPVRLPPSALLAFQSTAGNAAVQRVVRSGVASVQRVKEDEFVDNPEEFMSRNVVLFEYGKGFSLRYPQTVKAIGGRIDDNNLIANMKLLMADKKDVMSFYLQESGKKAKDDQSVYFTTPALALLPDADIRSIFKNGATFLADADDLVACLKKEDAGGVPIRASYAPYFIGDPNLKTDGSGDTDANVWDNVGHTVIDPRVTKFVFTDAMNGCAYAITGVKGDRAKFEAWHFQSETSNFKQGSHFRATKEIRDWFGVNDYYIGDGDTNLAATNIIWNSDGGSKMLSQKNIVPLKSGDPTSFQGFSSHDLNTAEDIKEGRLDEIHRKLKSGISKGIRKADIDIINRANQALAVDGATTVKSMKAIRQEDSSMSAAEVKEINRLGDNMTARKLHASTYPVDLSAFDPLAACKQELTSISSPGKVYGINYDQARTIPLKRKFLQASTAVLSHVAGLVDQAKQIVVTSDAGELNKDLKELALQIRFYFDIYEDYSTNYNRAADVVVAIDRLGNAKKAIARKNATLAKEREARFPSG